MKHEEKRDKVVDERTVSASSRAHDMKIVLHKNANASNTFPCKKTDLNIDMMYYFNTYHESMYTRTTKHKPCQSPNDDQLYVYIHAHVA